MKPFHMILALLITACWGSNFVFAKFAMQDIPPFMLLSLRFLFVFILLAPFVPKSDIPWKESIYISILLGLMHFAGMFGALFMGLDVASAVIAGQLGVPFSCILGSILLNDHLGRWRSAGMLVAFSGVVVIAGTPYIAENFMAFGLACLAGAAWGGANIVMKQLGQINILSMLCRLAVLSAPQLMLLSFIFESNHLEVLTSASGEAWIALAGIVLLSTIFAYGTWYWLLRHYPISQVTPYSLLIPVFGISMGQWFFDEPFTIQMQIGAALTILGVAIVTIRRPRWATLGGKSL